MARFVLTAQVQLQAPTNTRQVIGQIRNSLAGKPVTIHVSVKGAAQANKQIQNITNSTQQASSAAQALGRSFGLAVKRLAAFTVASRAVSLFTNSLASAVDEAIDFQREIVKVAQVLQVPVRELRGLQTTITNLSTGLGVLSKDLLAVTRVLSQAGVKGANLQVALQALAKSTLAPTFDDITQTAEGAVAIMAQFEQGVGALEGQLGSINAVAGQFAVESGDLIAAVRRFGGVFKTAGGSLEELLGLFTSVRATTRESGESIATGLRTIFTRVQRPQTIQYLRELGVELTKLDGTFVGPFEAAKRLGKAFAELPQGDTRFIAIAEELGGFRQIGKVIPLLQQYRVAQEALNVAKAGQGSLDKDAATAQQALAVQITKVREEFLALVRGIAESTSFQVFTRTALSLASAFIQIAETVKPLIPLLATVAAFKFAKCLGVFFAGAGASLRGIGKAQGGQIHKFARGGFVPGSGNGDTVPAMLTPGEFVIKKSSAQKLGAGTLEAMNQNRFAEGGQIKLNPGAIGGFFLSPEQGDPRSRKINTTVGIQNSKALKKLGLSPSGDVGVAQTLTNTTKAKQERLLGVKLNKSLGAKDFTATGSLRKKIGQPEAEAALNDPKRVARIKRQSSLGGALLDEQKVPLSGTITGYYPGKDTNQNADTLKIVNEETAKALRSSVANSATRIDSILEVPPINPDLEALKAAGDRIADDPNALRSISGFIFEGIIQALTGAELAGETSNFDFPASSIKNSKKGLKRLFTSGSEGVDNLVKADAKRSNSRDSFDSIVKKVKNDINQGQFDGVDFLKRAAGGGVPGTDTVPALLTPGEFVVNKKSAQSIGYGNLNSMNKSGVARFAKGGSVGIQKFAGGGGVAGVGGGGLGSVATFGLAISAAQLAVQTLGDSSEDASASQFAIAKGGERLITAFTTLGAAILLLGLTGNKSSKALEEFGKSIDKRIKDRKK